MFTDRQIAGRSQQCPKYVPRAVGQAAKPGYSAGVASPGDFSTIAFHVEPTPGNPGPSHPTTHYSRMRLVNVTNGQ